MRIKFRSFGMRSMPLLAVFAGIIGSVPAQAGGSISVYFDLRPTQCPNRLYSGPFRGEVLLPAAVLGTGDLDVVNVVPSSLLLVVPGGGGFGDILIPPIATGQADVATPVADPTNCNCTWQGPDVLVDLTMDFDASVVLQALNVIHPGNVNLGIEFPLCIQGMLLDGSTFQGCDCVLVDTPPVAVDGESWGRIKSGYR